MTYATGRTFYDADSHIMDLPNFLQRYADPDVRDAMPNKASATAGQIGHDDTLTDAGHPEAYRAELLALGDELISGPKNYKALGAFSADERTQALDLLGFDKQLVFVSFAAGTAFNPKLDEKVRYGASRAANRGMAEFCGADDRLMGVAVIPLDNPALAIGELELALKQNLQAVWIPHRHCGGRSPGHNDFDPFWARLEEAAVPFVLHVGGAALQIEEPWTNTGRPLPTDWLGGGENVRGKDMVRLHQDAEKFIGCLLLDGVLERFPKLRGGVIELGADWVPGMLKRLDHIAKTWGRTEPEIAALKRKPSEQITQQMAFTPFVFEDVGDLIRSSNPDLYLFSSDYPHAEGGRNPLGRFRSSLEGFDEPVLAKFYSENFERVFTI
ncbi:MAG: hydrolase [Gammaproteobacteria bacterium]|nr:MAG: hydrolase [Gammaproteobacteria bacterium]TDJ38445.1 MAG: hydrolase [Gammaproteobacteria bacterium]